jgi:GntR family transcriptional regulator
LKNTAQPLYRQVSRILEDGILSGAFGEGEQIPSTTEISLRYEINPATALKGVNELVKEGILFKKRGIGMFAAEGAVRKVKEKRKKEFLEVRVVGFLDEAKKLNLSMEDLWELLQEAERRRGVQNHGD